MNPRYLVDQLVRQTTVLIAQLSTASGIRALAHVADQVLGRPIAEADRVRVVCGRR